MFKDMIYRFTESNLYSSLQLSPIIRLIIASGILLRYILVFSEDELIISITWNDPLSAPTAIFICYSLLIALSVRKNSNFLTSKPWLRYQLIIDTILVSSLYCFSQNPESDLFLLFTLPLLLLTEVFDDREVFIWFLVISIAFLTISLTLTLANMDDLISVDLLFGIFRNIIPRWIFLLLVLFLVSIRSNILKTETKELEDVQTHILLIAERDNLDERLKKSIESVTKLLNATQGLMFFHDEQSNSLKLADRVGKSSNSSLHNELNLLAKKIAKNEIMIEKTISLKNFISEDTLSLDLKFDSLNVIGTPLKFAKRIIGAIVIVIENRADGFSNHKKKATRAPCPIYWNLDL